MRLFLFFYVNYHYFFSNVTTIFWIERGTTPNFSWNALHVAVRCSVLQCVALCCTCGVLQCLECVPSSWHSCVSEYGCSRGTARELLNVLKSHCNMLQHAATHWHTLQHAATSCNKQARVVQQEHCSTFSKVTATLWKTLCNTRQHTATHSNTRQHMATHGSTRQHTTTQHNSQTSALQSLYARNLFFLNDYVYM